jgi:SIR2-like protein
MKFSIEYLHPVARRELQNVRLHLNRGTAAFYLGAGVDTQLSRDSGQESPGWEKLLAETRPFPGATPVDLNKYARDWPTETALSARLRLGEEKFKNKITERTNFAFKPSLTKPFTAELTPLLLESNLIVTPNYASHVLESLKLLIDRRGLRRKKEIIVLTREDLASFQFPVAEPDPVRIFLIHIHGRCVEGSNLVFDAWGYNVAVNDDPYYHRFLYNLFSYRSVISLGTSWLDIPLRNQAALVFRTQSYQRPSHISLDFCSSKKEFAKNLKSNSVKRKWSNAMHAAYGVRMIVSTAEKQVSVLNLLNQQELEFKALPKFQDLAGIATFFDSCGDYESPLQQQWLLKVLPSRSTSPTARIHATVLKLYKTLITNLIKGSAPWGVVARLERHLRHFHYLYVAPYDLHDRRQQQLWNLLAQKLTKRVWNGIGESVRFQFLIGQYELKQTLAARIKALTVSDPLNQKRLRLGHLIWASGVDVVVLENTALRLLDIGWESMSAKLFLDAATATASKALGSYDPKTSETILGLAVRGGDIARSTGYFRREAKAETLAAMWLPDPQESRIRILSKIRAAEFHPDSHTKASYRNIGVIEPALMATLTAGLLASHIRSLDLHSADPKILDEKLKASVTPLLEEAGISWREVPTTLLPYWENLIEKRLQPPFMKAIQGDYTSAP